MEADLPRAFTRPWVEAVLSYRPRGIEDETDRCRERGRRSAWLAAIVAAWVGMAGAGLALLWRYESAPGALVEPPSRFPAASALRPRPGASSLLLFAHPHCSCTSATLGELASMLARTSDSPTTYVVIADAPGLGDVERSDAYLAAASIPGVRVVRDVGGREAALFRALTSGEVVIYDPTGRLAFHGGITAARGHAGDNLGRSRAIAALEAPRSRGADHPVYGCAIEDDGREP